MIHVSDWCQAVSERSAGEALAEVRKGLGWTQAKLAETLGFSTVLISKIESGVRAPSDAFIDALSSRLPGKADAVREAASAEAQPDGRKGTSLKIVDAMKLAKKNGERANRLKTRAEQLTSEANEVAEQLDAKAQQFSTDVIGPFAALMTQVSGIPEDVIVPADAQPSHLNTEFAATLKNAQVTTGRNVFTLLGAGALGGGAGAAVGAGAATVTYMTVASIATASTGAAISALSGAAATSATLAAIGGGSLAAGGLGIAGGTAMLTGIVTIPVLLVATGAVVASGGRILEKQRAAERKIERAETDFESNEAIVRRFVTRATRINEILTVALLAVRNHRRIIDSALSRKEPVAWSDLDTSTRASVARVAEIALAGLTVLSLQIGMNLKRIAPDDKPPVDIVDGDAVPQITPELDARPELENDFIDYAIEESFSQVAR